MVPVHWVEGHGLLDLGRADADGLGEVYHGFHLGGCLFLHLVQHATEHVILLLEYRGGVLQCADIVLATQMQVLYYSGPGPAILCRNQTLDDLLLRRQRECAIEFTEYPTELVLDVGQLGNQGVLDTLDSLHPYTRTLIICA